MRRCRASKLPLAHGIGGSEVAVADSRVFGPTSLKFMQKSRVKLFGSGGIVNAEGASPGGFKAGGVPGSALTGEDTQAAHLIYARPQVLEAVFLQRLF